MESIRKSLTQLLFISRKNAGRSLVSGRRPRLLRLEDLERRELLDVSTADYQAIADAYSVAELTTTGFEPVSLDALCDSCVLATGATKETPSVVVTTVLDRVDEYDGLISLREAIAYAGVDDLESTVVFADSIAGQTIALSEALTIDKSIAINASELAASGGVSIDAHGNGAFIVAEGTEVKLRNLTIVGGETENGGAIYNEGDLTLVDCALANNYATENGGAIYNVGSLTLERTSFYLNEANLDGGAIYNVGLAISSDGSFERNVCSNSGGAVYSSVVFTSTGDRFVQNESGVDGGAIYNAGAMSLFNDRFSLNDAALGGAVFNERFSGSIVVANTLFEGNSAESGAAVYNAGSIDFVNVTIANNAAQDGYGYRHAYGVVNFYNSVVVDSIAFGNGALNCYRTLSTFSNWSNQQDSDFVSFQYNATQPLFVDPASGDYSLAENSQAIDLGSNAYAFAVGVESDSTDLGGAPRFYNDTIDLGAYEYMPEPNLTLSVDEGFVYNTERDVVLATLLTEGLIAPTFSVDSNAFTVDPDARLVYLGGLAVGSHVVTISVSDAATTLTATFTLTVEQATLATPGLSAAAVGETSIAVTIDSVDYAERYVVQYSTSYNFTNVKSIAYQTSGEKTISGLTQGVKYYFRVKAAATGCDDSPWATASAIPNQPIDAPTLEVVASSTSSADVTFDAVQDATKYVVQYSTSYNFTNIQSIAYSTSGTKTIAGLEQGVKYYFRVKACAPTGYADSAWVKGSATPNTPMDVPTFAVTVTDSSTVKLSIGSVSGATKYTVQYSTSYNFSNPSAIAYQTSGVKTIAGLEQGVKYFFRVRAGAPEGMADSTWATTNATPNPLLAVPTLTATTASATSIKVTIGGVDNASKYTVQYSIDPTFATYSAIAYQTSGAKTISNLSSGVTYYFRVKAVGTNYADSAWATADATTPLASSVFEDWLDEEFIEF